MLLTQVDHPLASAMADGAYDTSSVYAALCSGGSCQGIACIFRSAELLQFHAVDSRRSGWLRAQGAQRLLNQFFRVSPPGLRRPGERPG
jgi:hypothetical protein